jgi:hypothetical protein
MCGAQICRIQAPSLLLIPLGDTREPGVNLRLYGPHPFEQPLKFPYSFAQSFLKQLLGWGAHLVCQESARVSVSVIV